MRNPSEKYKNVFHKLFKYKIVFIELNSTSLIPTVEIKISYKYLSVENFIKAVGRNGTSLASMFFPNNKRVMAIADQTAGRT